MKTNNGKNRIKAVIIGGGITGLSACCYLQKEFNHLVDITLIESAPFLVGKMRTKRIDLNHEVFIIDAGPELLVTRKSEAWELALELGLGDQIIDLGSETKNIYVLDKDKPKKIPLSP